MHTLSLDEALRAIGDGRIRDAKTVIGGLLWARSRPGKRLYTCYRHLEFEAQRARA